MLSEPEINEVFSNIEGIYELNKKFFADLTDLKEARNMTAGLGKCAFLFVSACVCV